MEPLQTPSFTTSGNDLDAAICEEMSKSLRRQQHVSNEAADKTSQIGPKSLNVDAKIDPTFSPPFSSSSSSAIVSPPYQGKPPIRNMRPNRSEDTESEHLFPSNYFSRTDATSSSSSETDTSSEDEKVIEELASRFPPKQKLSFLSGARRQQSHRRKTSLSDKLQPAAPPAVSSSLPLPSDGSSASASVQTCLRPPLPGTTIKPSKDDKKRRRVRRSVAANRRSALLRCMRQYKAECQQLENAVNEQQLKVTNSNQQPLIVTGSVSDLIQQKQPQPTPPLGQSWAEILPLVVSGFLDLKSVINLRQCCKRLYYKRRYSLATCTFEQSSTITEQELVNKVLPSLKTFLTARSLSQLNFSRCCLLTDAFPKTIVSFQNGKLRRHLRALYFDFCYALTDKALETLLSTSLPNLEILSLRCARSRDLTGAPFSQKELLTKERWPRFHQFSCSCTQMALPHLESVALFVAERAIELSVPPKLGISGSLACISLIRRMGLVTEHQNFIEKIVVDGTAESVEQAIQAFEKQWAKNIDETENKNKVLYRLLRNRSIPLLINAPCSMAVIDDGEGHEKAMWVLFSNRRRGQLSMSQSKDQLFHRQTSTGTTSSTTGVGLTSSSAVLFSCGVVDSATTLDNERQQPQVEACCQCRLSHPSIRVLPSNDAPTPIRTNLALSRRTSPTEITSVGTGASPSTPSIAIQSLPAGLVVSPTVTAPLRPPLPTISMPSAARGQQSSVDVSGTETDFASTTSTVAQQLSARHANYSRWSYPLPMAIRLGNLPVVQLLLQKGAHLDVWGYNFATPLYVAVANVQRYDHESILSKLGSGDDALSLYSVKVQEDMDTSDSESHQNSTAVMTPTLASTTTIVQQQAASPVDIGPASRLPSGLASPMSSSSNTAVDAEFSRSGSLGPIAGFGPNQCACCCHSAFSRLDLNELEERQAIVDLLLKCGAPVDAPDLYSVKCPVNASIKNDNQPLLETLITAGARINIRALPPGLIPPLIQVSRRQQEKKHPKAGLARLGYKSPLFFACELNARSCIETLLKAGADPHWRDPFSNRNVTPTLLVYRKDPQMLQLFVKKGAGSTRSTRWVLSEVLAVAILQDDLTTIEFLISTYRDLLDRESSGMWSLPLIQAARLNKVTILQLLLDLGADPNAANSQNLTALHFASSEGHKQALECLLQRGAKPNIVGGPNIRTPLHVSVEENRKDCTEVLLNYGADITIKDSLGLTPVMIAIASRNDKVAMLLIQRGTTEQLNVPDSSNRTSLMYAIYFGQFKVADALVERGVSCSAMDNASCTAEFLLKQKVKSLGKSSTSTSTINKILRNIVGAGGAGTTGQGNVTGGSSRGKCSDVESSSVAPDTKSQNPQMSEESVRKLNAKRRKIARRLLKKIRSRAKKDGVPASTSASAATSPLASPPQKQSVISPFSNPPVPSIISDELRTSKVKSPESWKVTDSIKSTTDAKKSMTSGNEKQRIIAGDKEMPENNSSSPLAPTISDDFMTGHQTSDMRPLEGGVWNVRSSEEEAQEDDISSTSSEFSDLSSDSEKEFK